MADEEGSDPDTKYCRHAWGEWLETETDNERTRSRHCVICGAIQTQNIPENSLNG